MVFTHDASLARAHYIPFHPALAPTTLSRPLSVGPDELPHAERPGAPRFQGDNTFLPGMMRINGGHRNMGTVMRILVPVIAVLMPGHASAMKELALFLINCTQKGWAYPVLGSLGSGCS